MLVAEWSVADRRLPASDSASASQGTILPLGKRSSPVSGARTILERMTESNSDDEESVGTRRVAGSFAERFKYIVCTSFLLTSSLSISFYDSAPPAPEASPELGSSSPQSKRSKPESSFDPIIRPPEDQPVTVRSSAAVYGSNSSVGSHGLASASRPSTMPNLSPMGQSLRNSAAFAVAGACFFSTTWEAWFRVGLVMASAVWGLILALGLESREDQIYFDLSHRPLPDAPRRLRYMPDNRPVSASEKRRIQNAALRDVRRLVKAAQAFDVSANKAISAIQEVELVARGFKLSNPMPPISRIEASNSFAPLPGSASQTSPSRYRSSLGQSQAQARLSSSSSAGTSAASNSKHGRRPLSLSMSASGRFSPVPSNASIQDAFARYDAEGRSSSANKTISEPHRLPGLRKALLHNFEAAGHSCRRAMTELENFVEKEEFALLKEMYALDVAPSAADAHLSDLETPDSYAARSVPPWSPAGRNPLDELADRRSSWNSTVPRNAGSRRMSIDHSLSGRLAMDDNGVGTATGTGQKRISLLSDGSLGDRDRDRGSFGGLPRGSKRESVLSDSAAARSPRLHYVSENSGTNSGPNESGASKRLSYASASSAGAAATAPSWMSVSSRPPSMALPYSPGMSSSARSISPSLMQLGSPPRARDARQQRQSILGLGAPPLSAPIPNGDEGSADPFSLLSIRNTFEAFHNIRRKTLCHLLALDFSMRKVALVGEGMKIDLEDYWESVSLVVTDLAGGLRHKSAGIKSLVEKEMNDGLTVQGLRGGAGDDPAEGEREYLRAGAGVFDVLPPTPTDLDETGRAVESSEVRSGDSHLRPPSASYSRPSSPLGHPSGMEDSMAAIALSLRSVQVKLRACADSMRVKPPMGLHGSVEHSDEDTREEQMEDPRLEMTERVFESIREDLLALSAEWESGLKLLRRERKRAPSPAGSASASISASEMIASRHASRELDSPLEVEEDAFRSKKHDGGRARARDSVSGLSTTTDSSDGPSEPPSSATSSYAARALGLRQSSSAMSMTNETLVPSSSHSRLGSKEKEALVDEDSDLAALLLQSTSPDHLPPPGLEQVFETIAGLAGIAGVGEDGKKMSREERIRRVKERRERERERGREEEGQQGARAATDSNGVVKELKDVITLMKNRRDSQQVNVNGSAPASAKTKHASAPLPPTAALQNGSPQADAWSNHLGSPVHLSPVVGGPFSTFAAGPASGAGRDLRPASTSRTASNESLKTASTSTGRGVRVASSPPAPSAPSAPSADHSHSHSHSPRRPASGSPSFLDTEPTFMPAVGRRHSSSPSDGGLDGQVDGASVSPGARVGAGSPGAGAGANAGTANSTTRRPRRTAVGDADKDTRRQSMALNGLVGTWGKTGAGGGSWQTSPDLMSMASGAGMGAGMEEREEEAKKAWDPAQQRTRYDSSNASADTSPAMGANTGAGANPGAAGQHEVGSAF